MPHTRPFIGTSRRSCHSAGGSIDTTAPIITSSNAITLAENTALSHSLTANESVTWSLIGGADQSLFSLSGNTLSMTAKDYESPIDADTNNTYVVQVRATDGTTNTTDQTITVTLSNVEERTAPLSAVISSVVFDLDATVSNSYNGTDTHWRNLIAAPADGSAQSAYDFYLGTSSSADTADPTFNGTAGDAAAYFTSDGADSFHIPANTSFINNISKNGGTDWWLCVALFLPTATSGSYVFGTRGGSPERGMQIRTAPLRPQVVQYQGGSAVGFDGSLATAGTANANNIYLISRKASDGSIKLWTNSATVKQTSTMTYVAGTADATQLARLSYIADAATSRLYHISMGNEYLDDTKAGAIIAQLETRHARDYTP